MLLWSKYWTIFKKTLVFSIFILALKWSFIKADDISWRKWDDATTTIPFNYNSIAACYYLWKHCTCHCYYQDCAVNYCHCIEIDICHLAYRLLPSQSPLAWRQSVPSRGWSRCPWTSSCPGRRSHWCGAACGDSFLRCRPGPATPQTRHAGRCVDNLPVRS